MRRFLLLIAMAVLITGVLAFIWLPLPLSSQEGVANAAKAADFFQGMLQAGGLIWWTPSFMGGVPLASSWTFIVTSAWIWMWTNGFGLLVGTKLAVLVCLPVAAGTMYWFARTATGSSLAAFIAGLTYFLSPSLWMRLASVEHIVVVCAMAVIPLVGLAILHLSRSPRTFASLLAAAACSLLLLTYGKAAILMAPSLLIFTLWALWKNCGLAPWLSPRVVWPLLIGLVLLGLLPALPSLRETQFAALFDFGPLSAWQHSFSSKSALVGLDRMQALSSGFRGDFAASTGAGGAYLGLIPLLLCGAVLIWRKNLLAGYNQPLPSTFRIGAALALFSFWLSCGPYSVLTGHFQALGASLDGYDFTPALIWILLALQIALIFWLLPVTMPLKNLFGAILAFGYLVIPAFPILSLLPLYNQIRAPFDFFQVCGPVWVALATGSAGALIFQQYGTSRLRNLAIGVVGLVWALDISGYGRFFYTRALPAELEPRFLEAAKAIKDAPRPGSILALSGRYFYLQLPALTGKPLSQEAFQDYLQVRGFTALWKTGLAAEAMLGPFLRVAGVSYVLYDKHDPDAATRISKLLSARYPILFENEDFTVWEIRNSLAPAFLAQTAVMQDIGDLSNVPPALDVSEQNILPIGPSLPGPSVGSIKGGEIAWNTESRAGVAYQRLPAEAFQRPTHDSFTVQTGDGKGWLVIPQAWHPDWTAKQDGQPLEIYRAFGALPAVNLSKPGEVVFQFRPPWWYTAAILVSGAAWTAFLIFLGGVLLFPRLRHRLGLTVAAPSLTLREPIAKALVICPTYNEKESIQQVLAEILASTPIIDILVIDDASPDGTADLVKAHAEFGGRVKLHQRPGKLGLGTAYLEGFRWAQEHGYPSCLEIDADLSHDPKDIPRLLEAIDAGADAAIGSRYINGLRIVNWPPHRLLLSASATQFVRLMTGLPLTDCTSGFKALRISALDKLNWKEFRAQGYGFQVELHYFLWKSGAVLTEVPITFTERRDGHTKMTAGIALEALRRVLQLTLKRGASTR